MVLKKKSILRSLKPLAHIAIAYSNKNSTPSSSNINPHTRGYLPQFLLPKTSCMTWNKQKIKLENRLKYSLIRFVKQKKKKNRADYSRLVNDIKRYMPFEY